MKKNQIKIMIITLILMLPIITVLGIIVIDNAINERHRVTLSSNAYIINLSGSSTNTTNQITKDVNSGNNDITYSVSVKTGADNTFTYDVLAVPVYDGAVLVTDSIESGIILYSNKNTNTFTISHDNAISGKKCILIVVPYTEYNAYVSSFFDLKMLNNEYRHMIIDNDSEIKHSESKPINNGDITDYTDEDEVANAYALRKNIDAYSSKYFKDIYLLNDLTIPYNYTINLPCSFHLLTNDINLDGNLTMKNYYKGVYTIDTINGSINENTYTFTINTPKAVNPNIEISNSMYTIDNTYSVLSESVAFASGFFESDVRVIDATTTNYAVVFSDIMLPTRYDEGNVTLKYYVNYNEQTEEEFRVTRDTTNTLLDVTIEATDGENTETSVVHVWVVGTSDISIYESFTKLLDMIIFTCQHGNSDEIYINIKNVIDHEGTLTEHSINLDSFLAMSNKTLSLSDDLLTTDLELSSNGVSLRTISSSGENPVLEYLVITRDTYNGNGYVYVNKDDVLLEEEALITVTIPLMNLEDSVIESTIVNEIGQIYFSGTNSTYTIPTEDEFLNRFHLDSIDYTIHEVFSGSDIALSHFSYDSSTGVIANLGAAYNSLYNYYLQVDVTKDGTSWEPMLFNFIVPSTSTGGDGENNIVSDLFTSNFDAMSTFIGHSNNFSSNIANFYLEIINSPSVSSFINIKDINGNNLTSSSTPINGGSYYFETIPSAIPTSDTTIYVNAYVTDRDIYADGASMKTAYNALEEYSLANGVYMSASTAEHPIPITTIYNSSNTITLTYSNGVVTSISSSDGSISWVTGETSPTIDLTSYSFDIVNGENTQTSSIFYDINGNCTSIFLQQYSFVVPGIYQEADFGVDLYSLLIDEYGSFEEMLPASITREKEKYLLASSVEANNDKFTNVVTIDYSTTPKAVTGVYNNEGKYEVSLDNYFYYTDGVKETTFYTSTGDEITSVYDLANGLYRDDDTSIDTIYSDISSLDNNVVINRIDNLYHLFNTKEIIIKNVDVSTSQVENLLNHNNDVLTRITFSNCNLTDNSFFDFSKLTNLETIDFSHNNLNDIPKAALKLISLNLSYNNYTTITDIEKMSSLQTIDLSHNHIDEFLPLLNLNNLRTANLSYNVSNNATRLLTVNTSINAYGTNGEINVGTFLALRDKGVAINDEYGTGSNVLNSLSSLKTDAYYVINAIVPLSTYTGEFYLDLSYPYTYELVSHSIVLLNYNISINEDFISDSSTRIYSQSLVAGNYTAIIALTYQETDTNNNVQSVTVYRQITFSITN